MFDPNSDLGSATWRDAEPAQWAEEPPWWSEKERSRPLFWPRGAKWFTNDPLGPVPHSHPDASEVFVVATGAMSLQVGRQLVEAQAGDFIHIPPDTYHEPLSNHGEDLCLLALISPNWRDLRWKTENFVPSDYEGVATVVSLREPGAQLPSDERIYSEVVHLAGGAGDSFAGRPEADTLVYAMNNPIDVSVHGLAGTLHAGQYTHVMAGSQFSVAAPAGCETRVLIIQAIDPKWKGDPDV